MKRRLGALVLAGLLLALFRGQIAVSDSPLVFAVPEFITPHFSWASLLGVGIPFFIVTMASQNAPGVATLKAAGYQVPISPLITITALIALILTPFGGFSVCIAAITAAIMRLRW